MSTVSERFYLVLMFFGVLFTPPIWITSSYFFFGSCHCTVCTVLRTLLLLQLVYVICYYWENRVVVWMTRCKLHGVVLLVRRASWRLSTPDFRSPCDLYGHQGLNWPDCSHIILAPKNRSYREKWSIADPSNNNNKLPLLRRIVSCVKTHNQITTVGIRGHLFRQNNTLNA